MALEGTLTLSSHPQVQSDLDHPQNSQSMSVNLESRYHVDGELSVNHERSIASNIISTWNLPLSNPKAGKP